MPKKKFIVLRYSSIQWIYRNSTLGTILSASVECKNLVLMREKNFDARARLR